jgi:hypothetical protein
MTAIMLRCETIDNRSAAELGYQKKSYLHSGHIEYRPGSCLSLFLQRGM